jgi:cell division protein FtsW
MTTATQQRRSKEQPGWLASTRQALDRPLTSYHLVLGGTGLLLCLGLVMVLSASSVYSYLAHGSSYYVFVHQALWVCIALPLGWVASRLPPVWFGRLAYPALIASVALVALTYVPGFGVEVNGNRNWLALGPVTVQPSEFAKLALVVWAAHVYARKDALLDRWHHLLLPVLPVAVLLVAGVVGQGDLGTALVLLAILLGMLWVVGAPGRLFAGAAVIVIGCALYLAAQEPYRVRRITGFLNPFADYEYSGWQAAHGFFALASGGWWGLGIGASRQKWGSLPEAHTDFIFAVIGEELGLFGTLVVLALFVTLAYAGVRIAVRAKLPFVRYAAAGITVWLLAQALINIGTVLGLVPVIGIPLPLVSYGGSALLPTVVALGMLLGFARAEPGALNELRKRRGQGWRARLDGRAGSRPEP